LQLGDFFNANDEFGLVILTVVAFTFFALAVFAVTYALSRSASVIAGVALILAIVALAPVALPGLIQKIANRSTNPYTVGIENTAILIELVVPALIVVLVQWGLVRRRWLRGLAKPGRRSAAYFLPRELLGAVFDLPGFDDFITHIGFDAGNEADTLLA